MPEQLVHERTFEQERAFAAAYERNRKKIAVAYVLAILLGVIGAHRYYLDRGRTAMLMLALGFGGFFLAVAMTYMSAAFNGTVDAYLGDFLAGLLMLSAAVWVLVDLFLIPSMVRKYNQKLSEELQRA
ncbi:MAG TPA: NINE protein [Terracidiphilus sp.]|jgi:TM2 domain-containing membrane protein YozV|nr:NINE protein [Terracidiphilus sp.]